MRVKKGIVYSYKKKTYYVIHTLGVNPLKTVNMD